MLLYLTFLIPDSDDDLADSEASDDDEDGIKGIEGVDPAAAEQMRAKQQFMRLFKGLKFFLSREVCEAFTLFVFPWKRTCAARVWTDPMLFVVVSGAS